MKLKSMVSIAVMTALLPFAAFASAPSATLADLDLLAKEFPSGTYTGTAPYQWYSCSVTVLSVPGSFMIVVYNGGSHNGSLLVPSLSFDVSIGYPLRHSFEDFWTFEFQPGQTSYSHSLSVQKLSDSHTRIEVRFDGNSHADANCDISLPIR